VHYEHRCRSRTQASRTWRCRQLPLVVLALAIGLASSAQAATPGSHSPRAPCTSPPPGPAADAGGAGPLTLLASVARVGCIDLSVTGAVGSSVTITELSAGAATAGTPVAVLPTQGGVASLASGLAWRCDRGTREFQVTETLGDGSQQSAATSVTTPSCATRLSARVLPQRLHRGYPATVAVSDRWGIGGLRVRACPASGHAHSCPAATLRAGRGASTLLRVSPHAAGRSSIDVSDTYETLRLTLHALASRPLLLATGDSQMQVLDDYMASDLSGFGGARVVNDARQSTAISSPFFFNWPGHAVGQVAAQHPDIVAMFLGGNEGFRLGSADCCSSDWSREYAARVAAMMRAYRQRGAASVYWFLIPTPSKEPFVKVAKAVNRGIISAASEFPEGVHAFDLRPRFSPGGRYIPDVHESDGFHLSASADHVVARMFIQRLRRDGVLP
jgi:hypothetical protein